MTIFVKYIQNKYLNAQVDLEKITVENEALLMYFQMLLDAWWVTCNFWKLHK